MINFKDKKNMIRLGGVLIIALLAGYTFFSTVSGIFRPDKTVIQSASQQTAADTVPAVTNQEKEETQAFVSYVIQKGDTLYSIAKEYSDKCPQNIVVKTITFWNNIADPASIEVGTDIVIPVNFLNSGCVHTVQKGDSLFSIARTYFEGSNTKAAVEKIKNDNFLTTNNISVGDELFITIETLN